MKNRNAKNAQSLITKAAHAFNTKQYAIAKKCYLKLLAIDPQSIGVYHMLTKIAEAESDYATAISYLEKIITLKPPTPDEITILGNYHYLLGHDDQAERYLQQAIADNPFRSAPYQTLGLLYAKQDQFTQALSALLTAVNLDPNNPNLYENIGIAYYELSQQAEAIEYYQKALELAPNHPEYHWNLALAYLQNGNYPQGFAEFEWRWQRNLEISPSPVIFAKPQWQGDCFHNKTLLLHAEQGFGDTLQFCRFAPQVKALGGTVILLCQAPLIRLLKSLEGIDYVVNADEPLPRFDIHCPLMSLPHVLQLTPQHIPSHTPYLSVAQSREWQNYFSSEQRYKIGIAWSGNPQQARNHKRSLDLHYFAKLAEQPNIQLYGLQKGPESKQIQAYRHIIDLSDHIQDFYDTAQIMQHLDLVISVCTSVCHLAGALNIKTWTLLQKRPCWRWQLAEQTSPWYPSMTLYRQATAGDWHSVFNQVAFALQPALR